ncbi:hypothetical protein [Sandaracinus amylolyticus]|uniref:Uncharacterized protein n=1 Tax=Sandaracinus amylolyticus TaxID=927083 RepID=A0A0F6SES1_9BACT|nr:hypothetical protein [Sandaracinus amylolyticus]AKF05684.1 hypothetical protein DB32_002833 [Sandaracinus amylolyticus]
MNQSFGRLSLVVLSMMIVVVPGCGDDDAVGGEDAGGIDAAIVRSDSGQAPFDAGAPEACDAPGTVEDVACGMCGRAQRFCTSERTWAYGPCMGETGECAPGTTDEIACGMCGTQTARCTAECVWEATGACTGEGECTPGSETRSSDGCAPGQTRPVECDDSCAYVAAGECADDGCTTPGEMETVACGMCGEQERFCTIDGVWDYDPCSGEGECEAGTTRSVPCGRCGTRTERCVTACAWDTGGACTGETGECVPGGTRRDRADCAAGETRAQTCSETCGWVDSGPCETTVRDAGVDGGRDAGPRDAGTRDAGRVDAGSCAPQLSACTTTADCCAPAVCQVPFLVCL